MPRTRDATPAGSVGIVAGPPSRLRTRATIACARSSPNAPSTTTATSQPAAAVSSGAVRRLSLLARELPATLRRRLRVVLGHEKPLILHYARFQIADSRFVML